MMIALQVPPIACDRWEIQWAETGMIVGHDVIASAQRHMRLLVQPIQQGPAPFGSRPNIPASLQGLSFRSGYLPQF